MGTPDIILVIISGAVGLGIFIGIIYVFAGPVTRGAAWMGRRIGGFIKGEVTDFARIIAGIVLVPLFGLLAAVSLLFIQLKAARRFGLAAREEVVRIGISMYRMAFAHPARLFGLEAAVENIETRIPGVLSGTWGDAISPRDALFPGYTISGTIPGGGSGAKLYIVDPSEKKRREFARDFGLVRANAIGKVLIKSFSTLGRDGDGGLPQLVRESQGLDAGKRLGLILDHGLTTDRFWYAMRFVPGVSLRTTITQLHREAPEEGLSREQLARVLRYTRDLLETLATYHEQGLWHKDVKPDNIIIEPLTDAAGASTGDAARLVDIGLVSSLRSAMTLTTHGTEYYRDPEMVRLALRGAKVHEVDGAKFDLYAVGAVLFTMLEDNFPAQGVLSPMRKKSPAIVQWIVRRAMADYQQRYASARDMLADVEFALASATGPLAIDDIKPARLPSMAAQQSDEEPLPENSLPQEPLPPVPPMAALPAAPAAPQQLAQVSTAQAPAARPLTAEVIAPPPLPTAQPGFRTAAVATAQAEEAVQVVVTNWWTGDHRLMPAQR
ncbi:MAG: protein kinase domain-containing protein [Phycisphaerae bacterium]|jgi:serine/threonine protein kinase